MFGLFRGKKRKIESWEMALLRNTIKQLPADYQYLEPQIIEELLRASYIGYDKLVPEFVGFFKNSDMIDKFENRKEKGYKIKGVKIYDKKNNKQLDYTIYVFEGVIGGYSIKGSKKFDIDVNQVDISSFSKTFIDNQDFNKLSKFLSAEELEMLDPGDVYEVLLKGKLYYHLCDLEDGDFMGIDTDKVLYKITHDPFEIIPVNIDLAQVLSNN